MKIMNTLRAAFDRIIHWCAVLSTITMVIIMFTNMLDTIMRWLKIPLYGVYELNGLMVGITIFLGLALTQKRRKQINVTLVSERLPNFARHIVAFITNTLSTVFFVWITYLYVVKAYQAFMTHEVIAGLVKFPVFPLKLAMALGLVLLTIQLIIDEVEAVKAVFVPYPVELDNEKSTSEAEVIGI